ncbi:MAG: hypothetical protein NVSMB57_14080 [Actinomycetota bacterium]
MHTREEQLSLLSNVSLFSELSKKEQEHILQACKEVHFPAGHTIVEQGSTGVSFHLILEGTADVQAGGKSKASVGPGDYFGEIAIIDGRSRSASILATSDVTTLALTSWDFLQIVRSTPSLAEKLMIGLCKRIRELDTSAQAD